MEKIIKRHGQHSSPKVGRDCKNLTRPEPECFEPGLVGSVHVF